MAENQVLNEGNPDCEHRGVYYEQNGFDGQAWRCDEEDCGRHERANQGRTMLFPRGALIRVPNPDYGGDQVYSFMADEHGIVKQALKPEQRVPVGDLEKKI